MTNRLLELFAADRTATIALGQSKKSYPDVAMAEIGRVDDSRSRFAVFMWLAADQRRRELLAASMVVPVDIWEMNGDGTKIPSKNETCAKNARFGRFSSNISLAHKQPMSAQCTMQLRFKLQAFRPQALIMQDFHNEDLKEGNSRRDVIERLVDFCDHPPPTKYFTTLREYLDYRIQVATVL
ncbi:hypothetical protein CVT25_008111 [Psilocybe cyanescens]|uniref:Uncharacterized protein n=1 Tax=Psilocybe cyanescens TaxID=93625 RepID=A0A409X9J4_PSICY|nr:hypothetical protein CVT25_008111 [Psilocybe cyanescens]